MVAPGSALDVFFLGQQALEFGIDLNDGTVLVDRRFSRLREPAWFQPVEPGSPRSGRRRPPPAEMTRRGRL